MLLEEISGCCGCCVFQIVVLHENEGWLVILHFWIHSFSCQKNMNLKLFSTFSVDTKRFAIIFLKILKLSPLGPEAPESGNPEIFRDCGHQDGAFNSLQLLCNVDLTDHINHNFTIFFYNSLT